MSTEPGDCGDAGSGFKQWVIRALAEVAERQEAERADEERRRRR